MLMRYDDLLERLTLTLSLSLAFSFALTTVESNNLTQELPTGLS
jgi:hypothetical protein